MLRTHIASVQLLRTVSAIVALAVLFWSVGFPSLHFVEAAGLTNISDTLSDSAPNVVSNHTIVFTIPSDGAALGSGDTITVTFPAASFDLSNLLVTDFDLATTTDYALAGTASGATWGVATTSNTIVFTSGTESVATGTTVTIEVGTNATFGGAGVNQIVNPASSSYEINVATSQGDSGATQVVILDNVTVTAAVDTTFTFAVSGVGAAAGSETVNGDTITGTTTATAIPFGELASGTATVTAQDLAIATNASQGFVVTVATDGAFQSSSGADIDGFDDGVYVDTPASWSYPNFDPEDEDTWGHWGITSEDGTTTRATEFGTGEYIGPTTTPRVVMSHDGPADAATQGAGLARVGYKVVITSLQEAGDDYSAVLTYVATPIF